MICANLILSMCNHPTILFQILAWNFDIISVLNISFLFQYSVPMTAFPHKHCRNSDQPSDRNEYGEMRIINL